MSQNQQKNNYRCQEIEEWINLIKFEKNWFSRILHSTYPRQLVFYGFSNELFNSLYSFTKKWNISPSKITIIIPNPPKFEKRSQFDTNEAINDFEEDKIDFPIAFGHREVWEFYKNLLESFKVTIILNCEIIDFNDQEVVLCNKEIMQK